MSEGLISLEYHKSFYGLRVFPDTEDKMHIFFVVGVFCGSNSSRIKTRRVHYDYDKLNDSKINNTITSQ